jgi:glutamate synthase (ferredoxin)
VLQQRREAIHIADRSKQGVRMDASPHGMDWRGECPPQPWLGEERDACGVGFVAQQSGEATREVIEKALTALDCMEHRGGCLSDGLSGDGAGIMTQVPWELLREWVTAENQKHCGVGMMFLPLDPEKHAPMREAINDVMKASGLNVLGWRDVPVQPDALGPMCRETMPLIQQLIVESQSSAEGKGLERQLYLARRKIAPELENRELAGREEFYIPSFSARAITYKGMMRSETLVKFYTDLTDERYGSAFAVYHRRFSTNTNPKWRLAQPMRMMAHNGELNTLLGNLNWQRAREAELELDETDDAFLDSEEFPDSEGPVEDMKLCNVDDLLDARNTHRLINVCGSGDDFEKTTSNANSDSANLDSVLEQMVRSGKSPAEALMLLVPEAYDLAAPDREKIKAFYRYYEGLQEGWDGPALLVFCDGTMVGAKLDRNGLRPSRYLRTKSGLVCFMSETGVVPLDEHEVVERGRLGPGQMFTVNFRKNEFKTNWEIKEDIADRFPYKEWMDSAATLHPKGDYPPVENDFGIDADPTELGSLVRLQSLLGWGSEDVAMQLSSMASTGYEATFCMGDDAPLAVLSEKPHTPYDYFKQRFAQVTNPAIDPLREGKVMSLNVQLGRKGNVLQPSEKNAKLFHLSSPIMHEGDMETIKQSDFTTVTLDTTYPMAAGPKGLREAISKLVSQAADAVRSGAEIVVLSDKSLLDSDLTEKAYIPPLLAVGAVHHRLIDDGLRMKASLITESGQAWSTHHMACLVGYGASAIHPYLAHLTVRSLVRKGKSVDNEQEALNNYRKSVDAGILKIMSKIGIGMLSSYSGAQIFEAIGLSKEVIETSFKGTPSRIGGMGLDDLAEEVNLFYANAYPDVLDPSSPAVKKLVNYGFNKFLPKLEYHDNSPPLSKTLHKAVRAASNGDYAAGVDHYKVFMDSLKVRPITAMRDLLELKKAPEPIPLDEVESVESIMKRFVTGGMSLGALSREAHEALGIAMNRIGGKSNCGEGGEDPNRFLPLNEDDLEDGRCVSGKLSPLLNNLHVGDSASSKIKQVASGRFGVSPYYLRSGEQIEIKLAQGAKPGEGGQLPGKKVDEYIAGMRASTPGVTLISPPPHHDIYSIEDLAQLIFDLKMVNSKAQVSVKLVSEVGIGTVACGVAKANADVIQVSGFDGGTGASPMSSIKHAGSPWELGLTEVHQSLIENGLRDQVTVRVDGGIKTGWDVVTAAALGGQEYGFGTIAMIAEGCIMARVCHLNTCPVGVTTQLERLRKKFPGNPDHVVQYFNFVADEVRGVLASIGKRSLDEVIGDLSVLQMNEATNNKISKTKSVDASVLLKGQIIHPKDHRSEPSHSVGHTLDDELLASPDIAALMAAAGKDVDAIKVTHDTKIVNTDRTAGARIAGEIAGAFGRPGLEGTGHELTIDFHGTAGQSFAAYTMPGMTLRLHGEANDYVGKSMAGGTLEVHGFAGEESENRAYRSVAGNTCLYGATKGNAFFAGAAGERFCVRNSGAVAVVEGVGDHLSEYQTGGVVLNLGGFGVNIGSGMTGGIIYFVDADEKEVVQKTNSDYLSHSKVEVGSDTEKGVQRLIEEHLKRTGSKKARALLDQWEEKAQNIFELAPKGSTSPSPLTLLGKLNVEEGKVLQAA